MDVYTVLLDWAGDWGVLQPLATLVEAPDWDEAVEIATGRGIASVRGADLGVKKWPEAADLFPVAVFRGDVLGQLLSEYRVISG